MSIRSLAPGFSKKFSFELPNPEVIKLSNSVDLVFLSNIQQEVFKVEVVFKAGKWYEPKPGLAHFTSNMLDKGTSSKTSKEIAGTLDYYGAQIEIAAGYDFVSISLYGLKKYAYEIFPLFIEIITDPIFSEKELGLQKEIFLQNLDINDKKNSFVASKLIRKNIFGGHHPYGNSLEREDAVEITRDELKTYFKSNFSPHEIYLIGNFDTLQTQRFVDLFSELKTKKIGDKDNPALLAGNSIQQVTKADSVQSSIRLGKRIINRDHSDYFHLLLLNHILGGYFGSRLMKNIREEKGLTYGIYSSLNPFKNDCMFSIGADVNKSNLELTVNEIKRELESLSFHSINEDELDIARNHLLGSLQLEVANPFSTIDKIKIIRLNQLYSDYYKNLFATIQSIKPDEMQGVAQKYFDTKELLEVCVG